MYKQINLKWVLSGLAFAMLWGSASTATKIGLRAAQPLVLSACRFALASALLLMYSHLIKRNQIPKGKQWVQLSIYGALNITIYLGCYVIAMQTVTAGIGALAVATNPVIISFLSMFFGGRKINFRVIFSLVLGSLGVLIASWPFIIHSAISMKGLLILLFSMLSYSSAAIYFSSKNWEGLERITINGWQTFLGGIFILPLALFWYDAPSNHYNLTFLFSVLWLAIPVSILAIQLWLWLLNTDTIKAGLWLFLCPVFGFIIAHFILSDPITFHTWAGIMLVLLGLGLSRKGSFKNATQK